MTNAVLTFGERLTDLRKEKKQTQQQVADALNISLNTYSKYERDELKDYTFAFVQSIAKYFDVSIDYLAGLKTNKRRQDTPIEELGLTDEAVSALKDSEYDHTLLSELLSHDYFDYFMLDIEAYTEHIHSGVIAQLNTNYTYMRNQLRASGQTHNKTFRAAEMSIVDEDRFAQEIIHKDIDHIVSDISEKHKPKDFEKSLDEFNDSYEGFMEAGFEAAMDSEAVPGSPEQLMDIIFGSLQIPPDSFTKEEKEIMIAAFSKSQLLQSGISQRGKGKPNPKKKGDKIQEG